MYQEKRIIPPEVWYAHLPYLKKHSRQLQGPCPNCGGTDRFHVNCYPPFLFGCRQCRDNRAILAAAGLLDDQDTKTIRITPAPVAPDNTQAIANEEAAARRAEDMVNAAQWQPHPYLAIKGFPQECGLVYEDKLLVPMRHWGKQTLQSVQSIDANGQKRFLYQGKASAAAYSLGRSKTIWYVEGLATGYSVRAALQHLYRRDRIIICLSAGNIAKVAKEAWLWHQDAYVVADNDKSGTGARYAEQTNLPWVMPPIIGDANDWHMAHGIDGLASLLRSILRTDI